MQLFPLDFRFSDCSPNSLLNTQRLIQNMQTEKKRMEFIPAFPWKCKQNVVVFIFLLCLGECTSVWLCQMQQSFKNTFVRFVVEVLFIMWSCVQSKPMRIRFSETFQQNLLAAFFGWAEGGLGVEKGASFYCPVTSYLSLENYFKYIV